MEGRPTFTYGRVRLLMSRKKHAGRAPAPAVSLFLWVCLAAILMFILVGCSVVNLIGGDDAPTDDLLQESSILICSQECSQRGQCGINEDGDEMVLLSESAPGVVDHDVAAISGTPVSVTQQTELTVVQVQDGSRIQTPFYLVEVPGARLGWVAGWCLDSK